MLFITKGEIGRALRWAKLHTGPFSQTNINVLITSNPVRSDNAWNEDHSENVYAQWRIVKLQAWDSVSPIYCLHLHSCAIFLLLLLLRWTPSLAGFRGLYFVSCFTRIVTVYIFLIQRK